MARSPSTRGPARKQTTMRLNIDLMKRITKRADKEHRSVANLCEVMLEEGLSRREKKPTGVLVEEEAGDVLA